MNKIISFTRSHWKKIGIASIPIIYGGNYVKTEYEISQHMRQICNNVKQYGDPKSNTALVILNPMANNKKCEKMFKKYCEPVLHMAGYTVEIVKTKHIGHAKTLIDTAQKLPDVVVIAGGDGTASEVVTGLLRRNQECCPILFLPLGKNNETLSSSVENIPKGKVDFVKYLSSSLLALIYERVQYRNVIKYEVVDDEETQNHKPIFGLHQFSWGLLRDIEVSKDKYWYFGSLRYQAAAFFTSLSNEMKRTISASLVCTPPCSGCNKCIIEKKSISHYNFSKLFTPKSTVQHEIPRKVNELCGNNEDYKIEGKQINITCKKNADSFFELSTEVIESFSSWNDFIKTSFTQKKFDPSIILKSRTIYLNPIKSEIATYYIDGEEYDARPVKISFIPNAIKCLF